MAGVGLRRCPSVGPRGSAPTLHLFNMRRGAIIGARPGQSADAHRRRMLTSRECARVHSNLDVTVGRGSS
ncbi:hypothetical protein TcasGA2_TC002927 [Tribolium castaneum]|uniref:Uncharacterized protein n=1 Tax=Tribolium castaneum TaxID=7070 RepID=D6WHC0_TRICA|nr:hypothetical protein TcasGA2_TC002927 [Tribolium castaneum]